MAPTRLINTQTFAFETRSAHLRKPDEDYPRFAIISHRWEDQEISYQEFLYFTSPQKDRNDTVARILGLNLSKEQGKGFWKVKSACRVAKARGYDWLWIDTCCINKDSSAELSEAINSMYEWYRDASECLVYLSTVTASRVDFNDSNNEFWTSEWWHRGWTLQELVAPQYVSFWDHKWQYLSTGHDLGHQITRKTGIPSQCLGSQDLIQSTAIATRISWARSRKTSRAEDTKAFRRLQEAIIDKSDDETIFAVENTTGLFARSPSDFRPQAVMQSDLCDETVNRTFSMIQTGIRMKISYLDMGEHIGARVWAVVFNCKYATSDQPFIRLFNVIDARKYASQTARLAASGTQAKGNALLDAAHNEVAAKYRKRKDIYKHEEVILMV